MEVKSKHFLSTDIFFNSCHWSWKISFLLLVHLEFKHLAEQKLDNKSQTAKSSQRRDRLHDWCNIDDSTACLLSTISSAWNPQCRYSRFFLLADILPVHAQLPKNRWINYLTQTAVQISRSWKSQRAIPDNTKAYYSISYHLWPPSELRCISTKNYLNLFFSVYNIRSNILWLNKGFCQW